MKKIKSSDGAILTGKERTLHIFMHVLLIALSACCLIPFLIILGSSFQSQEEIMKITKRVNNLEDMIAIDEIVMTLLDN